MMVAEEIVAHVQTIGCVLTEPVNCLASRIALESNVASTVVVVCVAHVLPEKSVLLTFSAK